ncbi:FAD-binding oxidoreductase [Streptomyces marianii]|uniref:FAD-binding oxidoreductase n=1 Tax=Streptomyces marianii TaxID=1817406 RepID=A0A5R9E088_9ACTN|nr:FAD-binding oxidoreductase [Streptomyces marianii]TLQ42445.1 FAD-binding oxidoreductase [Streptomyces marianii]
MISRRSLIRAGAGATAAAALTAGTGGVMLAQAAAAVPWRELRGRLSGTLVLPSDAAYDTAKQLQLAQFDAVRPRAVAYCASESDVAACIMFARENGIPAAVRSGGHSHAGYSTGPGLVIDLSRVNAVRVTGDTVHLGAGSQGVDIVDALAPHGLQVAGGTCPTVAIGGWIQGGGLGFASRKFGMGCDLLESARVVLADGRTVTASRHEHRDLFWALRGGGGGNFGIVTDFEVRPVRIPTLTTYNLNFRWADATRVILAWQEWMSIAPRELASELMFLLSTDAPAGTEPNVVLTGAFHGSEADCDRVLDRLVAAAAPTISRETVELPYQQAMTGVFGCGDKTVPQCHRLGYSPEAQLSRDNHTTQRNRFFAEPWTCTAAEAALSAFTAEPTPGQFRFMGFFPYGGRINEVASTATAFVHRDALFNVGLAVGLNRPDPAQDAKDRARSWVDGGFGALAPYSNHRSYQNYMDPALTNWREAYYGHNYARLRAVKKTYDPHRFFRFAQGID